MKTILNHILLTIALIAGAGCGTARATINIDVTIVIDQTDPQTAHPNAKDIISQLRLRADIWQGIRIAVVALNDREITNITVLTLESESEWSGNEMIRKVRINHFEQQLEQAISIMQQTVQRPFTIAYRTIARQANRLAASNAAHKILLVYSDLIEHTPDLNFYDTHVINRMQKSPKSIDTQLEAVVSLQQHLGLDVWFIYNPSSYQQNITYMVIANFYQHLFSAHGATVHITNRFMPI